MAESSGYGLVCEVYVEVVEAPVFYEVYQGAFFVAGYYACTFDAADVEGFKGVLYQAF